MTIGELKALYPNISDDTEIKFFNSHLQNWHDLEPDLISYGIDNNDVPTLTVGYDIRCEMTDKQYAKHHTKIAKKLGRAYMSYRDALEVGC